MSQAGILAITASSITGIVSPVNGGTGVASPTAHTVAIAEGSAPFNFVGPGTAGQVFQSGGAGVDPSFTSTLSSLVQANITQTGNLGNQLNTTRTAFLAVQFSTQNDVTGNGAVYTLGTTTDFTEIFDQAGNFDPTTGIFTAPVTGRYMFSACVTVIGLTGLLSSGTTTLATSNANANRIINSSTSTITAISVEVNALLDMDAADTAFVQVSWSGNGANTADVFGTGTRDTFFSGYLAC